MSTLSNEEAELRFLSTSEIAFCEETQVYLSVPGGRIRAANQVSCTNEN